MNFRRLIVSLIVPQLAGMLGTFFTPVSVVSGWYASLEKPFFAPPNWLFGPVWIALYILMGISIYLIWQQKDKGKETGEAMRLFWIHLVFNAIWSPIFFGMKNLGLAFIDILIILIFIVVMIVMFWKISKWASWLLVPYLFWIAFALALNYFVWYLN